MLTDPIADLRAALRARPAFIIHFSGVPKGTSPTTPARRFWDRPTSVADCVRSFTRNGDFPYNEWLVGPYRVVGLFVTPNAQIQEPDSSYRGISPGEVLGDVGQHPLFSCVSGNSSN